MQVVFDSPERYGKGLDWTGYTVHDAANIFRRYLNQLPEPIVPLEFYEQFRDPLRLHQAQAVGQREAKQAEAGDFDHDGAVATYQKLITELPPLNRQLLLYVLDLLAVFASKAELNRMNSDNLAAIFQPGILSHPSHDMAPEEYRLSRDVLIFLIENQDNFLFGMSGTAVDEKTVKDMEEGRPLAATSPPKVTVGRSASNASGGADSLRRLGRHPSASSRRSRGSTGPASPGTPIHALGTNANASPGSGVQRSNTVPTKKSPALGSARFGRQGDQPSPGPSTPSPIPAGTKGSYVEKVGASQATSPLAPSSPTLMKDDGASRASEHAPAAAAKSAHPESKSKKKPSLQNLPASLLAPPSSIKSPTRERKISNLFARSPILHPRDSDNEQQRDGRQPNKLRKRQKIPGSSNESAQSSQNSLHAEPISHQTFHTPLASPDLNSSNQSDPMANAKPNASAGTSATAAPSSAVPTPSPSTTSFGGRHMPPAAHSQQPPGSQDAGGDALKPAMSPTGSIYSRSSYSDVEAPENGSSKSKSKSRRSRWPLASPSKVQESVLVPPPPVGQNTGACGSNSSIGSSPHRPRKSFTGDSQQTQQTAATTTDTLSSRALQQRRTSQESSEVLKDNGSDHEKKSLFGKLKAKITHAKDEKKERETEKIRSRDRTRSPAGSDADHGSERHRHNLVAAASAAEQQQQHQTVHRGRSMDVPREKNNTQTLPSVSERVSSEGNNEANEKEANFVAESGPNSDALGLTDVASPVPPTPITAIRTTEPTESLSSTAAVTSAGTVTEEDGEDPSRLVRTANPAPSTSSQPQTEGTNETPATSADVEEKLQQTQAQQSLPPQMQTQT